jgi:hypothetical protein
MSEKELKAEIEQFVNRLLEQRNSHANFDFFIFFDIDNPEQDFTSIDTFYTNTFTDVDGFYIGMTLLTSAMVDCISRGFCGDPNDADVSNNTVLRTQGFGGYIVN